MTPRDYLASLEFHGIKLGLDNIHQLMDAAGNPQQNYPTIHVAGTNGKGSVVAFTASMLRAAGYKVGRFTSPHLLDVSERFLVDGNSILDTDLDSEIEYFRDAAESFANPPTYFELCTAVALRYFKAQSVDVAVIEVGMGGRFDSTNIIEPMACVITNIDFDHMKYLGDTLEAIAFEKAGVIKAHTPVVVGERRPGPFHVIESVAREQRAPLILDEREFTYAAGGNALNPSISYRGKRITLTNAAIGLAGIHQVENAALAMALVESVAERFGITDDIVAKGIADAHWPCRLERVLDDPPVYIDVAHNPAGIQRLVESMPPCVVVFAASSDKNVKEMIAGLGPITEQLLLAKFDGPRATSLIVLEQAAGETDFISFQSLRDAIETGLTKASAHLPLLITGSIFTAAQARQILTHHFAAAPLRF